MSAYGTFEYETVQELISAQCGSVGKEEHGWLYFTCPECKSLKAHVSLKTGWVKCWHPTCFSGSGLWFREFVKAYCNDVPYLFKFDSYENKDLRSEEEGNLIRNMPDQYNRMISDWHEELKRQRSTSYAQVWEYLTEKRFFSYEAIDHFKIGFNGRNLVFPYLDMQYLPLGIKYRSDPRNKFRGTYSEGGYGAHLYNLQILNTHPTELILCEGEPDTIALFSHGFSNVLGVPGAGSFKRSWLDYFDEVERVTIIFDMDKAGQAGALEVAKLLHGQGINVHIAQLPLKGDKDKKDLTDYIAQLKANARGDEAIKRAIAKIINLAPKYGGDEEEKGSNKAKFFHDLLIQKGLITIMSGDGTVFASLPETPVHYHLINSATIEQWIIGTIVDETGEIISSEMQKNLLRAIAAYAYKKDRIENVPIRAAVIKENDKNIYFYDLGDGKHYVRMCDGQWQTIEGVCPVPFYKTRNGVNQCLPERGGSLQKVLEYVNIVDPTFQHMFLIYLVCALVPNISRPILYLSGDHGSGKSTLFRVARSLIDPSNAGNHASRDGELLAPVIEIRDAAIATLENYCVYFDNMSYISPELSDIFARFVTGGRIDIRALHTSLNDRSVDSVSVMCLLGINSINNILTRNDLVDRSIFLETKRIKKSIQDKEFWTAFHKDKPKILGAMFDTLAKTFQLLEANEVKWVNNRLGDYYKTAHACGIALGLDGIEDILDKNASKQDETVLENSVLAELIYHFYTNVYALESDQVTTVDLIKKIEQSAKDRDITVTKKEVPKHTGIFAKYVERLSPELSRMGITITKIPRKSNHESVKWDIVVDRSKFYNAEVLEQIEQREQEEAQIYEELRQEGFDF